MTYKIAFIGGGNMATSLVGGLIASGTDPSAILVAEPDSSKRTRLSSRFGVSTTDDNISVLTRDVVVLSVKPQLIQTVCRQLAPSAASHDPLFISIAAGIRTIDIARWLEHEVAIVRCMPNTPALIQCGATALFANAAVSDSRKQLADTLLRAAGTTAWVSDEDLLDVVTAVSGSGPAYFFLLIEAMQQAAVKLGLNSETATGLTLQTALGAARMANESTEDTGQLRARVTSKGGTTAAAIASFEQHDFHNIVSTALQAAYNRSRELADELGKDK